MNINITAIGRGFTAVESGAGSLAYKLARWRLYALTISVYLVATLLTDAFFMGDAKDYVDSIIAHKEGINTYFWEFGHLIWRPLGWALTEVLHPVTSRFVGPYQRANAMLTLVWINWAAGLLSTICLTNFLGRFCRSGLIIGLATVGFIFSQGVLNFSQTGSSYVAGLGFLLLGLCFVALEPTTDRQAWVNSVAAGLSFAAAVGFWFLFVWALPAAILLPLILRGVNRDRIKSAVITAASCSAFAGLMYAAALAILRISSVGALKSWVLDAGHGINVRGFNRLFLGVARTFINMGNDGMLMKRFLLGDPYNQVSVWALTRLSLWKLALFYLCLGAVIWMLWKTENRVRYYLLLAATAPVFGFAYFFGPADIERYLAWYPFFFLLAACAVENTRAGKWVKVVPGLFLLAVVTTNTRAMYEPSLTEQQEKVAARLGNLPAQAPPKSEVVMVNWQDELVNFYRSFPFHPLNQNEAIIITALVTPGVESNKYWREYFARLAFRVWSAGGEVWLSSRAFSPRPEADWNWVEGDDKNISWKEFPEFFANVDATGDTGGPDSFRQVLPSQRNRQFLQRIIDSSDLSGR